MRWGTFILLGITVAGCASNQPQPVAKAPVPVYDDAVAASLVFDPPVVSDEPRFEVSRDGRAPAAFAGFEDVITTFYYLRQDDYQQGFGRCRFNDHFEREAITERVGVSYR
jgi:hypothetical protein